MSAIKPITNSKINTSLRPLLLLHSIFGYDYGLFKSNRKCANMLIKIISTSIVFALPAIVLYFELLSKDLDLQFIYPVQYFIEALTTTYIFGSRIINNLNNYEEIDNKLGINNKHYRKLKWNNIVYVLALLFLTLAYMGSLRTQNDKGLKASSLFLFILDISFILRINLFEIVHYRIKKLRRFIERYHDDDIPNESFKVVLHPENYLTLYEKIADQLCNINKCIGFTFTFSFSITLLKFISLIYDISVATDSDFKVDLYFVVMSCSLAIHTLVFLGAPGLVGEMILIEANKIKLTLAEKLLRAPCEEEERYILRFMEYIAVRPLDLVIWRLIPLNLKLFNSVMSFCVTVFIFIMQLNNRMPFLHLTDTDSEINAPN